MSKIDGYSVFQSQYYDKTQKNGKNTAKTQNEKTDKTDKTSKQDTVELSDKAKELLKELQQKYGDMDFFVANYSSDAEAQSYLSRGTKAYSVLIDPETLEAMAADVTSDGRYFIYTNGGKLSRYPKEGISPIEREQVKDWVLSH